MAILQLTQVEDYADDPAICCLAPKMVVLSGWKMSGPAVGELYQ